MSIFLVSYDLNHEDGAAHYTAFAEALRKLNVCRVLNNAALVHVNTDSAEALVRHLHPFLEADDRIFAVRVAQDSVFYLNAYPGTNDWIAQNIQAAEAASETGSEPDAG